MGRQGFFATPQNDLLSVLVLSPSRSLIVRQERPCVRSSVNLGASTDFEACQAFYPGACRRQPRAHSRPDKLPFKFGDAGKNTKHQPTVRCRGVPRLSCRDTKAMPRASNSARAFTSWRSERAKTIIAVDQDDIHFPELASALRRSSAGRRSFEPDTPESVNSIDDLPLAPAQYARSSSTCMRRFDQVSNTGL